MVADHDLPFRARQLDGGGADRAVRVDTPTRAEAAVDVGAGVGGVREHAEHARVGEPPPAQLARPGAAVGARGEPPAAERAHYAVGRAGLLEAGEHVGDRRVNLLVGIDHRLALVVIDVADGQREAQLAALGGRALGSVQPAGEQVQLGLRHRALEPEQQPVVEVGQVVDPV
jgi:hypothetical protein